MDLIYANPQGEDISVIQKYNLDYESSIDVNECAFVLDMPIDEEVLQNAGFIYVEGTEIGGIIDSQKVNTASKTMNLTGRTWRGILGSKIIEPEAGESHYIINQEINRAIETVLQKIDLDSFYTASAEDTGVIVYYQFDRYTDAYTGLSKMLASVGYKMILQWQQGSINIHAEPIVEYTEQEAITSDLFDFEITSTRNSINHMIGLGQGELEERMVIHKYIQEDGTVGDTQYYYGAHEYAAIYDKGNAKDFEDLELGTIQALEELAQQNQISIDAYDLNCDLGDKFTAHDVYTGIVVEQYVTDKIVTIKNNVVNISYKVGALK